MKVVEFAIIKSKKGELLMPKVIKEIIHANAFTMHQRNGLKLQMRLVSSANPDVMAEPMLIQILPLNLLHGFLLNSNCILLKIISDYFLTFLRYLQFPQIARNMKTT